MNKSLKIFIFSIPVILFAVLMLLFAKEIGKPKNGPLPSALLGKSVPEFALPSLLDPTKQITPADWQGKLVLVNFWATWCAVCHEEHAFLKQIQQKYHLPLYGVNYKNERDESLPWLARNGNPFINIAYDIEGELGLDMGLTGAPETFLVNEQGIILAHHSGLMDEIVWQQKFQPVIEQQVGGKG